MKLFDIVPTANASLEQTVRARWDSLTKPPGSLGQLEDVVTRLALQQGVPRPKLSHKGLYLFCGDHGITAEGVSAYPSEVTRQMVLNFAAGGAAINVLSRQIGLTTVIVDAGVKGEPVPGVLSRRIRAGTRNFAVEAAMTRDEAVRAIEAGAALADSREPGGVCGVGEMGIGNSTSASALLCVLAGVAPEEAAGPGTGLGAEGVAKKADVIRRAIALHRPDATDAIGVLAQFGGYEIAMMTGFLLGSAERRLPVVMDGFISCAGALAASRIAPAAADYLIFSHRSAEPAHQRMLQELRADPLLKLSMRLGEGSGAALGILLLEQALALYDGMATFEQAAVTGKN